MKQILTFIKLYKPWLILLQLAGFFSFFSTSNLTVSLLIMLSCSVLTAILILVFPDKNRYYLYNSGYSFTSAYSITATLNVAVFAFLASIINLIIHA
jgi:hypothetical protein